MTSSKITLIERKQIRDTRKANKMSQKQLADLVGISKTYISLVENGKIEPKTLILRKIRSVLKLDIKSSLSPFTVNVPKENINNIKKEIIRLNEENSTLKDKLQKTEYNHKKATIERDDFKGYFQSAKAELENIREENKALEALSNAIRVELELTTKDLKASQEMMEQTKIKEKESKDKIRLIKAGDMYIVQIWISIECFGVGKWFSIDNAGDVRLNSEDYRFNSLELVKETVERVKGSISRASSGIYSLDEQE